MYSIFFIRTQYSYCRQWVWPWPSWLSFPQCGIAIVGKSYGQGVFVYIFTFFYIFKNLLYMSVGFLQQYRPHISSKDGEYKQCTSVSCVLCVEQYASANMYACTPEYILERKRKKYNKWCYIHYLCQFICLIGQEIKIADLWNYKD